MRLRQTLAALVAIGTIPAATAHAQDLGTRPLEQGDNGPDVRELQTVLGQLRVARLQADGAFGSRTARAVRRYERREDLRVDGRVSIGQARGMLRRAGRPGPSPAAKPASSGNGAFPVAGDVTWGDGFGERDGGHDGQDLLAPCGTPLVAARAGTVRVVGNEGSAGQHVVLRDDSGEELVYMHMQSQSVSEGATVTAGQTIGELGQTGNATTCHLHFEQWTSPGWYKGGSAVDPEPLLRSLAPAQAR